MAIPNTSTFSMQDVATELGLSNPVSFLGLISSTEYYKLDPDYYDGGVVNELLEYRNYGGSTSLVKQAYSVSYDFDSAIDSCGAGIAQTVYQDSWSFNVVDPIYILDQSGLNFINASAGWYSGGDSDGYGTKYVREWSGSAWLSTPSICVF